MSSLNSNIVPMFAGLPSGPKRRNAFATSFVLQALGLALLVQLGVIQPAAIIQKHQYVWVSLAPPPPVNHEPQKVPAKLLAAAKPKPIERAEVAHLDPPKVEVPVRKPDLPEVKPQAEKPAPTFPTVASERSSPKPLPQVKAGVFSTGSSATPNSLLPANKVQTGGFGDPNGVPAGNNTSGRVNIAALGSFDLPQGSGYGNGTGGSRGARAVVVSSGFGNGVATGSGLGAGSAATVKSAGFSTVEPMKQAAHRVEEPKANIAPVQILSKPTPGYTAEARAARVEGEVLLEVVFTASGQLRVIRVVRSLGHGLDESAIRAAEQIRFKPATRSGSPIDSTATLHIVFQMA
ncbi:MAG: TonB family protein [Acidobacteriia bacterium]|nr:TonB family protein [Terriglobia bacterium]